MVSSEVYTTSLQLKCFPTTLSKAFDRTPYPGGAPANVAAALGKLGAKVGFITAFGNDELAEKMQQLLSGIWPRLLAWHVHSAYGHTASAELCLLTLQTEVWT